MPRTDLARLFAFSSIVAVSPLFTAAAWAGPVESAQAAPSWPDAPEVVIVDSDDEAAPSEAEEAEQAAVVADESGKLQETDDDAANDGAEDSESGQGEESADDVAADDAQQDVASEGETESEGQHRCFQMPDPASAADRSRPVPFADIDDEAIHEMLRKERKKLGSMSLGRTNAGALFNGVQVKENELWSVANLRESWATQETLDYLTAAVEKVHEKFPGTPRFWVRDISDSNGGDLNPHLSHQSGRDADLGWFFKGGIRPKNTVATSDNLDMDRAWAFLRALLTESDVDLIFIDRRIQVMLYEHALSMGEDRAWLDKVFQYPSKTCRGIIRHAKGHKNHLHVRFFNPKAQEMGRRAYGFMLKDKIIKPPVYYVRHKVRRGQTLGHLAVRYHTSVKAIKRANGLRSHIIRAGRKYRIPRRGGVARTVRPLLVPERHVPPHNEFFDGPRKVADSGSSKGDPKQPHNIQLLSQ